MRTVSKRHGITPRAAFLPKRLPSPRIATGMALLAAAAWSPATWAQSIDGEPTDVAGKRPQPDYDPAGVRLGKLMVRPTLTIAPDFLSNVFAESGNARSDVSVTVTPGIAATLSEPGASLLLYGEAKLRRYDRYSSQDDDQFRFDASGSTELPFDVTLNAGIGWSDTTAARGTVANDLSVGDPLKIRQFQTRVGLRKNFNRLYATTDFSAVRSSYDDIDLGGGASIDQGFRNSRRAGGILTLGYEVSPLLALETRVTYDEYRYSDPRPAFNRNADSYSVGLGFRYQITQLLTAEFNAGLREHDFDNPLFARIKGVALSGRLRWYPTPLISVRADLSQSTTTSALDQVSAVTVTDFKLGADYEFRRNILFTVEAGTAFEDYGQVEASAKRLSLTGRVEWKLNRWLRVGGYASVNARVGSGSSLISDYSSIQTGVRMTFAL